MPLIQCVSCRAERPIAATRAGRPRLPRDWKLLRDQTYCPACKQSAFALRAVILPVTGPEAATWAELREELRTLWADATRCANWLVSELYARDIRRAEGDRRLAPMPHIYLYPEARAQFPRLPAQAVAALTHEVQRRYRASRFAVLWSRTASLASYKYPVGLTLPLQAWSLHEEDGRWVVSVRLSSSRWRLKLRGGERMRRQQEKLRQIVTGAAERGSITIYESSARGQRRSGSGDDAPRVMIKIAAWLPKTAAADRTGAVLVRTDAHSLLTADARWRIDPAPLRGVLAADARRRSALIANLQIARAAHGRRDGIERALRDLSRRTNQRLADACRTYAAHLTAHVVAAGVQAVHYDDRVRPDLAHFPWELLRKRVAQKLDEHGIHFVHANAVATSAAGRYHEDGEHAA